jgi:hypothetical protein
MYQNELSMAEVLEIVRLKMEQLATIVRLLLKQQRVPWELHMAWFSGCAEYRQLWNIIKYFDINKINTKNVKVFIIWANYHGMKEVLIRHKDVCLVKEPDGYVIYLYSIGPKYIASVYADPIKAFNSATIEYNINGNSDNSSDVNNDVINNSNVNSSNNKSSNNKLNKKGTTLRKRKGYYHEP